MALPSEAPYSSIVTFCAYRRKAHRMAYASVHEEARNAAILSDIRNRQDKPCKNKGENRNNRSMDQLQTAVPFVPDPFFNHR